MVVIHAAQHTEIGLPDCGAEAVTLARGGVAECSAIASSRAPGNSSSPNFELR